MNTLHFRKRWNDTQFMIGVVKEAMRTFHNSYTPEMVNGSKKAKTKPNPALQLTIRLLQVRASELHQQSATMMSQAYEKVGDRFVLNLSLFEPLTEDEMEMWKNGD